MKIPNRVFGTLAEFILVKGAKKATKYLSPSSVVKATFHGKRYRRSRSSTVLFTVGAPNYAERIFIKSCKKAGETFPVRKVQLRWK